MWACHGGVGCDVGEGCGVVIVSGREVRFVVGGKKCRFHRAMSLDACIVAGGGHGELVVGCQAGNKVLPNCDCLIFSLVIGDGDLP